MRIRKNAPQMNVNYDLRVEFKRATNKSNDKQSCTCINAQNFYFIVAVTRDTILKDKFFAHQLALSNANSKDVVQRKGNLNCILNVFHSSEIFKKYHLKRLSEIFHQKSS